MNMRNDTNESLATALIDLGSVKAETRGALPVGQADTPNIPNQCFQAGLSAD